MDCEPGYYRNGMMTQCDQCRANSYSSADATNCIDCGEGQLVNTERTSCGKYYNSDYGTAPVSRARGHRVTQSRGTVS